MNMSSWRGAGGATLNLTSRKRFWVVLVLRFVYGAKMPAVDCFSLLGRLEADVERTVRHMLLSLSSSGK
jgi:hypothetical protein